MSNTIFNNVKFDMPKSQSNAIKVIGVGGGGSNAVNHMYSQDIKGVDFVICNTDAQALQNSPIPNKVQLGADLTSGLGAGANPDIGAGAAKESIPEIEQLLNSQTKMIFITAGMGGGTGTGAAPIIASIAKKLDILTVAIVTMPFQFEGRMRTKQAQKGVDELREQVDSLIVINNNKLREVYGNLGFKAGFSKADEVLSTAAKGIAEVITHHYKQNIDLHDAKTVLSNSGTAIMGSAKEVGENRAQLAIMKALDSPLLNDNKITGAKNVLLLIVSGTDEITLDEIGEINDYIQQEAGYDANIIMGVGEDEALGEAVAVTIVATGFAMDQQKEITNSEVKKIYHTLDTEQTAQYNFEDPKVIVKRKKINPESEVQKKQIQNKKTVPKIVHQLFDDSLEKANIEKEQVDADHEILNVSEDDFVINEVSPDLFSVLESQPKEEEDQTENICQESNQDQDEITEKKVLDVSELPVVDPEDNVFTRIDLQEKDKQEEDKKVYTLEDHEEDIQNDPVFDQTHTDSETVIRRYDLEDVEVESSSSQIEIKDSQLDKIKDAKDEEGLVFKVKPQTHAKASQTISLKSETQEISPLNMSIDELRKRSSEKSKNTLKNFNKRYKNSPYNEEAIEGIEKEPAYKRLGLELHHKKEIDHKSDSTVNITDENQLIIRKNNSFLHDNVD